MGIEISLFRESNRKTESELETVMKNNQKVNIKLDDVYKRFIDCVGNDHGKKNEQMYLS